MDTKSSIVTKIQEDWGELCQSTICLKIFEYLLKNKDNNLTHITYGSLVKLVGSNFEQADILKAIQYVCGERVHLLDANFELIDENDESFDLSKKDVNRARLTGKLIHPDTGEEIVDFDKNVFMYFQPSSLITKIEE